MKQVELGRTGLMVSELCLGSMTWGTQNTEAEGHAQIDRALERGVNFIDTAEMYPTNPVTAATAGDTEAIIGSWLAARGGRDRLVLATKIVGRGSPAKEGGSGPITPEGIRAALEASLSRLCTDHVDLYQFHWPNRGHYHFRRMWTWNPAKQPSKAEIEDDMAACLDTVQALVAEGKIRHFGLSNETCWGMAEWLRLADAGHGPRAASVQNEYSLMYRVHDTDMAELSVHEGVTLLAYSPLAVGMLSGKYTGAQVPDGSRMARTPDLGGRALPRAFGIADLYVDFARGHGLDPVTMAIAWILTRPFPVVPILGATSVEQLDRSLDAADTVLSPEVLAGIERIHRAHPLPF
ncbi:aldo/keto reductase [Paenirhodobacter enshiensis]|uniref:Aldo/keto reductase n=1 Tax=Paenirhodobacter enshiensis TaxID=1105367 RepID=A0A086Y1I5_9RHOB|nr:aldo/keto reductase [Paenirhodobacter enshiensis]KFI28135.1 aldo/keto reductase [Paenirhodobacter enshiensis]